MNQFEMIAIIVVAVMIASVLRAKYGHRSSKLGAVPDEDRAETLQLRNEVKQLKERIHVLERIATDRENTLAREIEDLRDQ